jgi:hypothetical protein
MKSAHDRVEGADRSQAERTIQLLGLGSRTVLLALGLAEEVEEQGSRHLALTDRAFPVMLAAAMSRCGETSSVDPADILSEADEAVARIEARAKSQLRSDHLEEKEQRPEPVGIRKVSSQRRRTPLRPPVPGIAGFWNRSGAPRHRSGETSDIGTVAVVRVGCYLEMGPSGQQERVVVEEEAAAIPRDRVLRMWDEAQQDQDARERLVDTATKYVADSVSGNTFRPLRRQWEIPYDALDRFEPWLRHLVEQPLEGAPGPAAASPGGVSGNLVIAPVTPPVREFSQRIDIASIVTSYAPDTPHLVVASTRHLVRNELRSRLTEAVIKALEGLLPGRGDEPRSSADALAGQLQDPLACSVPGTAGSRPEPLAPAAGVGRPQPREPGRTPAATPRVGPPRPQPSKPNPRPASPQQNPAPHEQGRSRPDR